MKQISNDVYVFESTKSSRAFLIKLADRCIVIDTSLPKKGEQMLAELADIQLKPEAITDILLTHHDLDHIGNAAYLQTATGAKVWMHELDIANNMVEQNRPALKRVMGMMMKPELPKVDGIISEDGEVVAGITAIHTPGHTPGHTVYLYKDILFAGDAVKVKKDGSMTLLPNFLTADKQTALNSKAIIESLPYSLICPAHQEPVTVAT